MPKPLRPDYFLPLGPVPCPRPCPTFRLIAPQVCTGTTRARSSLSLFCLASLLGLRTRLGRAGPAIAPSAHPPSARYPRPAPTPSTGVPLLSDPAPAGPAPPRTDPRLPSRACVPLGPARPLPPLPQPSYGLATPRRRPATLVLSVPNPMIQSCKSRWDLSPSWLRQEQAPVPHTLDARFPKRLTGWNLSSPSWQAPRGTPRGTRSQQRCQPCCSPLGDENGVQSPWAAQSCPGPTRRSAGRKL